MGKNIELRIATPDDNKALIQFHKQFPISAHGHFSIDRCHNYFTPYEIHGEQSITYIICRGQEILGKVSFVIQDLLLDGKIRPVAFGRDLRITHDRHVILSWGKHFVPVVEEVFHTFGVKHLFSVMSLSEMKALNTFIRPRNERRELPRYHLYRRFNFVSLHGQLPCAKMKLPHVRVKKASEHHLDALIYYICQKSFQRNLSSVWDSQSFHQKLERWNNLKLEDFLLAVDQNDNIIGCCAPWSARGVQEHIPLNYDSRGHNFQQFLKLSSYFGYGRKISPAVSEIKKEFPLDEYYLSFLFADNEDIFERLLWSAYDEVGPNGFLVYNQMRSEMIYRRPHHWISAQLPFGVYYINLPDKDPPKFIFPQNEFPIEMESFFI